MSETLGLSLHIDGDITAAKKRIDELSRYADSTLGKSFSRAFSGVSPTMRGPTSPVAPVSIGLSGSAAVQIESAIKNGFSAAMPSLSNAISTAIKSAMSSATVRVDVSGSARVANEIRREFSTQMREFSRNARASGYAPSRQSGGTTYVPLSDFERSARRYAGRAQYDQPAQSQDLIGRTWSRLGFGDSGMANKPSQSRATAYGYQSGLFRDRAVGGLFTVQQAIEDYSYAGLRGAANNIAFMAASIGGPAGLATVAALGAYQLYELGKAAHFWGNAAREAEERTKRFVSSMSNMIEVQSQMRQQASFAGEAAGERFSGAFSGPGARGYQEGRFNAIGRVVRGAQGQRLVDALARDIQSNPVAYAGVAPGVQDRSAVYNSMQVAQRDAERKRTALKTLRTFGGQLGGKAWMDNGRVNEFKPRMLDVASEFGSAGTDYVNSLLSGHVDLNQMKRIEDQVSAAEQSALDAVRKHDESIKTLGLTAASTARDILSISGSNAKAADSVEAVIRKNQILSAEYEKQKRILREKAVAEDRSSFQSQGFDLMRSKGRQYMEQAGAPEWMIQQRDRNLYERQGSMLYGMANASGQSGDIQGRIKYLKELQQLQMQLAGNSDNRYVSERAFSAAIYTQSLIEDSIRKTTDGSQQEYQMIQQLASGVTGVRDMILQMPKLDLGLERQIQLAGELRAMLTPPAGAFKMEAGAMQLPTGFATGGHIPGYGGGDRVPAMLEKGEFVVRKEAVRTLGAEYLHNVVNKAHAQKFASGGYVGYGTNHRDYRFGRRMSNQGLPWYVNGRLRPRHSVAARESVDEWMSMYGTQTYRERLMAREFGSDPIGSRAAFASVGSDGPNVASTLRVRRYGNVGVAESSVFGRRTGSVATGSDAIDTFSAFQSREAQRARWAAAGVSPVTGRGGFSRMGFGSSGTYGASPTRSLSGAALKVSNARANFAFAAQQRRASYQAEMAERKKLGWRGVNAKRNAFNQYASGMFGGGFGPYQGGPGYGMSYEQMAYAQEMMARQNMVNRSIGMMGPWANRSFGLWDQGSYGLGGRFARAGLRGFAKGGFVDPYRGTLVAENPNIMQEGNPWQLQGYIPWANAWNVNDSAFAAQRDRVLAGSLNSAYGGPTDFAGNTLGSFGRFSDGSFKSRYSGGFGSGMGSGGFSTMVRSGGFGSGMGSGGFSSFGKPIGAMTGGYVTGVNGIQKFAAGGLVNATQARDVAKSLSGMGTGSSVHNNFGNVTIRVESPRDALDTTNSMRRSQASFWSRRG